jgi:hypothetical protein
VDQSRWWSQTAEELVQFGGEHGFGYIADKLPDWLAEPAAYGGDDTTMALVCDGNRFAHD